MSPFNRILVPTDFGDAAARALDLALALASKFDSTLILVHATWFPPSAYGAYAEVLYWPTDEMAKGASKELETLLSRAKERCPNAEGVVVTGEPWQAILDVAKDKKADLIVMGTHGRQGLSRVLIGSVAERIVRLSPVPVLTISGRSEEAAQKKALLSSSEEKKV